MSETSAPPEPTEQPTPKLRSTDLAPTYRALRFQTQLVWGLGATGLCPPFPTDLGKGS